MYKVLTAIFMTGKSRANKLYNNGEIINRNTFKHEKLHSIIIAFLRNINRNGN